MPVTRAAARERRRAELADAAHDGLVRRLSFSAVASSLGPASPPSLPSISVPSPGASEGTPGTAIPPSPEVPDTVASAVNNGAAANPLSPESWATLDAAADAAAVAAAAAAAEAAAEAAVEAAAEAAAEEAEEAEAAAEAAAEEAEEAEAEAEGEQPLFFTAQHELGMNFTVPFIYQGEAYLHAQGALQAAKHWQAPRFAEAIRLTRSACIARRMGQAKPCPAFEEMGQKPLTAQQRCIWERSLPGVLEAILSAKINSCTAMRRALLSTGTRRLVYLAGYGDAVLGSDCRGFNLVGTTLQRLRSRLRHLQQLGAADVADVADDTV